MTDQTDHVDLPALLRGELDNGAASAAGDHLTDCGVCRQALVTTAVGHALMTRAAGTLDPVRRTTGEPALPADLPPLAPPPRRRPALVLGLAAAAAAVVAGTTLGVVRPWADETPQQAPVAAERSATLTPLEDDGAGEAGVVTMTDEPGSTRMVIETDGLPALRTGQFYYAWLLDPATNKMLPLGQVGTNGSLTFELDPGLISSYSAVDVSLEDDDGDPQHSPVSVLRGSYA